MERVHTISLMITSRVCDLRPRDTCYHLGELDCMFDHHPIANQKKVDELSEIQAAFDESRFVLLFLTEMYSLLTNIVNSTPS